VTSCVACVLVGEESLVGLGTPFPWTPCFAQVRGFGFFICGTSRLSGTLLGVPTASDRLWKLVSLQH